jgi:tetratricopeptide (TPR) repeat protein
MSTCNYECIERESLAKNLCKFVEQNNKLLLREKVKIYEFAIEMTNSTDAMMDLAILYETHHAYKVAERYYLMALKYEKNCPVLYYNVADMCMTMYKKGFWFHKQYALRFFAKGADLNDLDCMMKYICHCPIDCEKAKDYLSKAIEHPNYKKMYCSSFTKIMDMVTLLDEMQEPLPENVANEKRRLNSMKIVSNYKNKVQLFTKLSHICECPICYEEKLNIDLNCGHCFCKDCYQKIVDNDVVRCPICRN